MGQFQAALVHRHGEDLPRLGDRAAGGAGDQQNRAPEADFVLADRAAHRAAQHRGDQRGFLHAGPDGRVKR